MVFLNRLYWDRCWSAV